MTAFLIQSGADVDILEIHAGLDPGLSVVMTPV